jgi:hypothetical protein
MNGATGPISGLNTLADWQDAFRRQTTDAGRAAVRAGYETWVARNRLPVRESRFLGHAAEDEANGA